jgi:hypothetical protein
MIPLRCVYIDNPHSPFFSGNRHHAPDAQVFRGRSGVEFGRMAELDA